MSAVTRTAAAFIAASLFIASVVAQPAAAAQISIVNNDGPGEGFNDGTAVPALPGNPATTLGAQRLNAMRHAADLVAVHLRDNGATIAVEATFDYLGGSSTKAVLGQALPTTVNANFFGAPLPNTWYVAAQANAMAGADLNGSGTAEVSAQFNSAVDNQTVLGSIDFYYGYDGQPGSDFDFVTIAMHELIHGLGFFDLLAGGAKFQGLDDTYLLNLRDDNFVPVRLAQMSDGQRAAAVVDGPDLVWDGASVVGASGKLAAGVYYDGSVEIYAPSTFAAGSSTTHFSNSLSPNEIMEPFANGTHRDLELTLALLEDIGWPMIPCGDATGDGVVSASDALGALQTAVGGGDCPLAICDADSSGSVLTADALRILQFAVKIPVAMLCPFPL